MSSDLVLAVGSVLLIVGLELAVGLVTRVAVAQRLRRQREKRRTSYVAALAGVVVGHQKPPVDFRVSDREFEHAIIDMLGTVAGPFHDALLAFAAEAKLLEQGLRGLGSRRPRRRIRSIAMLGALGDERARIPLKDLLWHDDVTEVQIRAADGLARIANAEDADTLLDKMASAEPWMAVRIADSVLRFERRAVPGLVAQVLGSENSTSRSHLPLLLEMLGHIGDPKCDFALVHATSDTDGTIRAAAIRAMGQIGSRRVLETLINSATDASSLVRAETAKSLGEIGTANELPLLAKLVADTDWDVRQNAAESMARTPKGRDALERISRVHWDRFARETALDALRFASRSDARPTEHQIERPEPIATAS